MDRLSVIMPVDEHYHIPLCALSFDTEMSMCQLLDRQCYKFASRCPEWSYADVRGAIIALGYKEQEEDLLSRPSPAQALFRLWAKDNDNKRPSSIGMLIELFHQLERYDILYEIEDLLNSDLKVWRREQTAIKEHELHLKIQGLIISGHEDAPVAPKPIESRAPIDIVREIGPEVIFDAVFSFDNRSDYARGVMRQMYEVLSGPNFRFRLCEGVDKLRVGVLKLEGFMTLVNKRCRHVIVLLSRGYVNSDDYQFQFHFSRSVDPMAYSRKVIPVLLENIEVPPLLIDIVCVNYYKVNERRDCYRCIADGLRKDADRRGSK